MNSLARRALPAFALLMCLPAQAAIPAGEAQALTDLYTPNWYDSCDDWIFVHGFD